MKSKREKMTASGNAERYTSHDIVDRVRDTFGGRIDVDPASCDEANRVVLASRILTSDEDGLSKSARWDLDGAPACVFVNPPSQGQGDVRKWWIKLTRERREGRVKAFVFLCFRVDAIQSMTLGAEHEGLPLPHDFWRCEPKRRLSYRTLGELVTKHAMHSSALFCGGPRDVLDRFCAAFADVGPILAPRP